jgi:ribosome recycling factor
MEDIQFFIDSAEELMDKSVQHLGQVLMKIRAGKAMPNMLDGIMVEYYGTPTPMNQVSSINTPDARSLMIKPWEKNIIPDIERAIINSDLGLNPQNDGEQVIINIPALTEERRITLVKQVKHEGEQGKISIRNGRHDCQHHLKELKSEGASEDDLKQADDRLNKMTEIHSKKIDELVAKKEEEIMTV